MRKTVKRDLVPSQTSDPEVFQGDVTRRKRSIRALMLRRRMSIRKRPTSTHFLKKKIERVSLRRS